MQQVGVAGRCRGKVVAVELVGGGGPSVEGETSLVCSFRVHTDCAVRAFATVALWHE